MHSLYPLLIGIIYWLAVDYLQPTKEQSNINKQKKIEKKQQFQPNQPSKSYSWIDYGVITHNLILCIFSGVIFYYSFVTQLYPLYKQYGFDFAVCHGYSTKVLKNCHYAFYISKYYEFLDTAILLSKSQRPIILSKYHHCLAPITMWVLVVTQSPAGWIFTVFNSFIHTGMYAYYLVTFFGFRVPFKPLITVAQLTQFVTGIWLTIYVTQKCSQTNESILGTLACVAYVLSLIVLFTNFFIKTYITNSSKSTSSSSNKNKIE
jgi:hypothetical protein